MARISLPLPRSRGVLQATELLLILPLLVLFLLAIVEFGLLWSANLRVKQASHAASRVATLPVADAEKLQQAVAEATKTALDSPRLVANHQLHVDPGHHTGDQVTVEVTVPMSAAAPDLLAPLGLSLENRLLRGKTVMRKE